MEWIHGRGLERVALMRPSISRRGLERDCNQTISVFGHTVLFFKSVLGLV